MILRATVVLPDPRAARDAQDEHAEPAHRPGRALCARRSCLSPAVGVALALARQAHLDLDGAHEGQAVDAQERRVRIGVRGHAVDVLEAAHDGHALRLDGQARRHDYLGAAHDDAEVELDGAGRQPRVAEVEHGRAHRREHAHLPRHDPRSAALGAAHERVDGLGRAHLGCGHEGGRPGRRGRAGQADGQIGEQGLDGGGGLGRVGQRHAPLELVDVQRRRARSAPAAPRWRARGSRGRGRGRGASRAAGRRRAARPQHSAARPCRADDLGV